jgi:hypothetical protein
VPGTNHVDAVVEGSVSKSGKESLARFLSLINTIPKTEDLLDGVASTY